jgi:hypothetical protein
MKGLSHDHQVVTAVLGVNRGGIDHRGGGSRIAAQWPGGNPGHRRRVKIADGHRGLRMQLEDLRRQLAVTGPQFEDARIRHVDQE